MKGKKNQIIKYNQNDLKDYSKQKEIFNIKFYDFIPKHEKFIKDEFCRAKEIYFSKNGYKICLKHKTNRYKIGKITNIKDS